MITLVLEDLKTTIDLFSSTQCDFLSENCIVALETKNHCTGCVLHVSGDVTLGFSLNWNKPVKINGYKEPKKYTEKGAEAISFFLTSHFTGFKVIEEAVIKTGPERTGIDYWLGYSEDHEDYDADNFMRARLEVSGILEETPSNTVKSRAAGKKRQVFPTDKTGLPAFISIVEFSSPKAYFGKK